MPKEIKPAETTRAKAFDLWMCAPNPMVTFFKTLDVTNLVKASKRRHLKFNMLLNWCVGKAASGVKEFYLLPVGGKLIQYAALAVNTIVKNKHGEVSSCDIPYSDDLEVFNRDYLKFTVRTQGGFLRACRMRLRGYKRRKETALCHGHETKTIY